MTEKNTIETIIDGSLDTAVINDAVWSYMEGITTLAFPPALPHVLDCSESDIARLKTAFVQRTAIVARQVESIILEINRRASYFKSVTYNTLTRHDTSLWEKNGSAISFGALACVDKGVPAEAIAGPFVSLLGRTLGGDIEFSYIPHRHSFVPTASPLIKRFIHYGRQGTKSFLEPLIEHTSCGRRGQILANDGNSESGIPSLGFIFEHLDALVPQAVAEKIHEVWRNWPRKGASVVTPDGGAYAGIVQKMAQRQALSQLSDTIAVSCPIELYEKETGNVYAGIDVPSVLTDKTVISNGGFTQKTLADLAKRDKIFSLAVYSDRLFTEIFRQSGIKKGAISFDRLRHDWDRSMHEMVAVTETLWRLYESENPITTSAVKRYTKAIGHALPKRNEPFTRRMTHHLFHNIAYAYALDTFAIGNPPGTHHIEQYLATGNHETGMKPHIALGQGDMDRPDATEIFTGYSVLLHSDPGHEGSPIPVTMKQDTDRNGDRPMSTEETNVALEDMKEFLKLWPYFLVGDMIPVLMVRGKQTGGVSRLGLSVLKSFSDIATLYEISETTLPRFVPATNSVNEVVLIPAKDILKTGCKTANDLSAFRAEIIHIADQYSDDAIQRSFAKSGR